MNAPYDKTVTPSEIVDATDQNTNNTNQISDPYAPVAPAGEAVFTASPVVETPPYQAPVSETVVHEANAASPSTVLNTEESARFRTRWNEIQGKFVDEPRDAVKQADALVTEVVAQIAQMFANEHSSLESQWNQGNDVSTEDLRKALQHYRAFFNRLVV